MKQLTFKNNDTLPALGLGTWKSKKDEVGPVIREAIRIGYRHFDCAAFYGNEAEIGAALSKAISDGDVKREELWITSKLWNSEHHPNHVRPALEKTLSDLQLEYLDLYLVHWPVAIKKGYSFPFPGEAFISLDELPILTTWKEMEKCLEAGLVRHIGVSNFSSKKIKNLVAQAKHAPEVNQVESHPLLTQTELFETCQSHGIHMTAYSPLGTRDRPEQPNDAKKPDLFELPVVKEIAHAHGASPAQVLIAWQIQRGWSVIPKSSNPHRLRQNFEAANLNFTDNEMKKINSLDRHYRIIDGLFWTVEGSPYTKENLWDEK